MTLEIPQQNSPNKPEAQKLTLSTELQIQFQKEKEQIILLSKSQLGSLSNDVIVNYLTKFHNVDISKYPKDIQQKFFEEIQMIFSEFKDFDESMITRLREIRENMSFGMEEGKSDEYYRNMILGNKINTRITILQESLKTIYSEKIKIGNTEYNKVDYEYLKTKTQNLDKVNGLDLFSKINLEAYNQNYKQIFATEIKKQIDPSNPKYNLIMTDLTRLPQIIGEKGFENLKQVKLKNGQIINLEELFQEYNKTYKEFKTKNRVFEFGDKQIKGSQKGFGFEEKKYGIGYDELKDIYQEKLGDVEKMGTADLVIMMRILFGVIPLAGDVVGGYDDGKQALAGVNFDGSIHGLGENVFMFLISGLQLSIVGGGFAKLAKGPKLVKAMETLGKIIDKLSRSPEMLKDIAKNEKIIKMLEMMKGVVPKVEELLEKIKNGAKKGTPKISETFPNTTRVMTEPKKQILPKIQPGIILGNIESLQEIEKYSMDVCSALGISKNSEKYKTVLSDISILFKKSPHNFENTILVYKGILKLNPNFLVGKIEKSNYPFILEQYYSLLRNNDEIKNFIITKGDNKVIFRMIDDFGFEIPHDGEDFKLLFKIFENFPDQHISTRFKALDIFSSGSDNITNEEKYKLVTLLLLKGVDEKLLQNVRHTYLYGEFNLIYDEGLKLRDIIRDETKSKAEIENAIHNFYKILEEKQAINLESLQISAGNPWDMVDLNELRDGAQRNPLFERFSGLLNFREKFNPKTGLEYIKKLPLPEKQKAMKIWKEKLKEQLDIMSSFPTDIKKSAEKFDYTKDKPDVIVNALINEFVLKLEDLSIEQRKQVITGIEKYVNKKFIVHKYASDPKYINNPKQLIADAYGIDLSKLKGEITMDINGANFTFHVHNGDDYKLLYAYGDEELAKNLSSSGGFASKRSKISELEGTISVSNGKKEGRSYALQTQLHETKHMDNQILMPDHTSGDNLSRAKDEIIAFLTDGSSIEKVKNTLFHKGDGALYDYYKNIKERDPERYKKLRILYEKELYIAIDIAQKFKAANIPNYLDVLAITPVRQWGSLEKIYLNQNLSEIQKMEKNMQQIFQKVYETSRAVKTDTDNLIGQNFSSFIFYSTGIVGMELIIFTYLNDHYPTWPIDIENNTKKYYEKMKILLNENNIKSYLENII